MVKTTKDIEKKLKKCETKSKEQSILFVFHTLFLQMGIYLFVEPSVAIDTLQVRLNSFNILVWLFIDHIGNKLFLYFQELQNCYEHHTNDIENEKNDELNWVEVVVELMLSLLARESYLLRQLISRIFSHLCSELTPQASHQILQVN